MPINRPSADALLEALQDMLSTQFIPNIESSELKYQSRVALHTIGIIRRELAGIEALDALETEGLQALLESKKTMQEMVVELRARIKFGTYEDNTEDLFVYFEKSIFNRIEIDNPNYPTYLFLQENDLYKLP